MPDLSIKNMSIPAGKDVQAGDVRAGQISIHMAGSADM